MKILIIFLVLSIINVILSTVRSILTIKGDKLTASLINGGYFAFYNIVLIYSVAEFPMWQKCLITFICNVLGVYIVKLIEQKAQKEKFWKIECTIENKYIDKININVPHSTIKIDNKYTLFNFYCQTKIQSQAVMEIINEYKAKYFITVS